MKISLRMIASALIGSPVFLAGGNVYAATDLEECKAGYKMMLMTPGECRGFLRELRSAQARADHLAVLDLQEWHTALLIERSQACPCRAEPAIMQSIRKNSPSAHVAYSGKY
jgi:hypothetical protein